MNRKIPSLIFIILSLWSCALDNDTPSNLEFPQRIKAKTFEINTPKGWELIEDQGYDTYVGRIKNNRFIIFFDQGFLSFRTLVNIQENSKTLYFQKLEINGAAAIIHKEKMTNDPSHDTILSVYIDNGAKKNKLYVLDSENDEFFIELFKTHKFLD